MHSTVDWNKISVVICFNFLIRFLFRTSNYHDDYNPPLESPGATRVSYILIISLTHWKTRIPYLRKQIRNPLKTYVIVWTSKFTDVLKPFFEDKLMEILQVCRVLFMIVRNCTINVFLRNILQLFSLLYVIPRFQ